MDITITLGQTVFARWKDGYYYPAVVDEILEEGVQIAFLDGDMELVSPAHIVDLQEAFQTMQLQGNWQNFGVFYKGRLDCQEPMVMYYNDGDVEQVGLSQLRGVRPGEPTVWKQAANLAIAGAVLGLTIYGIRKVMKRRCQRES